MANPSWAVFLVILICLSSSSDAFVRQRRSSNNEENGKPAAEVIVPEQPEEIDNAKDENPLKSQVRKRRQWNSFDSAIKEIFMTPSSEEYDRVQRNIYQNGQNSYLNNYIQQPFNQFPVYGPPSYQPNNFVPNNVPVINNHYLPSTPNNWFRPFFCYYPIVITIPPYPQTPSIPNIPNNIPTDTNVDDNNNNGMPNLDNRFNDNVPEIDASAYNNTLTGISLLPIPPAREPSITAPPVERPEDSVPEQPRPQAPRPTQRPNQRPQPRPTQRTTPRPTRPPANNYRPPQDNSIAPNYPIYYPDDNVSQNVPNTNDGPSPCVTAIVWCCLPNTGRRIPRERCFEINGCPGAFFDSDPCDSRLAIEALRAANNFQRRG